jgi:hypothetical protein
VIIIDGASGAWVAHIIAGILVHAEKAALNPFSRINASNPASSSVASHWMSVVVVNVFVVNAGLSVTTTVVVVVVVAVVVGAGVVEVVVVEEEVLLVVDGCGPQSVGSGSMLHRALQYSCAASATSLVGSPAEASSSTVHKATGNPLHELYAKLNPFALINFRSPRSSLRA